MTGRGRIQAEQIRDLLAAHRANAAAGDSVIVARPGGGWLIITATHVHPDGTEDERTGTVDALAMYDADQATEEHR